MTTSRLACRCAVLAVLVVVALNVRNAAAKSIPSIPSLPPQEGIQVPTCTCQYEAGHLCECGPSCSITTTDVMNCSTDGLFCLLYCRTTGLDICTPQNCRCKDCEIPLTPATRTAQDGADCADKCERASCTMDSYSEDIRAFCKQQEQELRLNEEDEEPTAACFPGDATVIVNDVRGRIPISELRVGDSVLTAHGVYSDVYAFSHADEDALAAFTRLHFKGHAAHLTVSRDHLLYASSHALTPAGEMRAGDTILHAKLGVATISSTETVSARGLYNPHTLSGTIVVDGAVASCFTRALEPTVATMLTWPLRVTYRAGFSRLLDRLSRSTFTELLRKRTIALVLGGAVS